MVNRTLLFYKEQPVVEGTSPNIQYFFEAGDYEVSAHNLAEFIESCKSLKRQGFRVCEKDIVTTLDAPQIVAPKIGERARFVRVPLTAEELAGLYHRIFNLS